MKIKGTVVYKDLEGGFWGIEGDDGEAYHPIDGIPAAFRREGARVEADVEPVEAVTIAMWGRNVKIRSIDHR